MYLSQAEAAGLSAEEMAEIVSFVALDPMAGVVIPGTGGARKIRFAGRGKGKSGGYRVITYYAAEDVPVFLLSCLSKGQRADISQAERNALRRLLGGMAEAYRRPAQRAREDV